MLQDLAHKEPSDLVEGLLREAYQCYRVGPLLIMVAVVDGDLELLAVVQQGRRGAGFRDLATQLKILAETWGCKRITSSAYDPRVYKLLLKIGAKPVAWHMELEV